ncbi:hypothetical protein BC835DRAFT_1365514 [Cytidiella melzeri]|nr:hypothetical protein BC835DRAFT_1365514 [Cytidiella melzeri]
MSLDANLFTLNFTANKDDPNVTDLVDPSDNPHYRKERVLGTEYRINVYEPLSGSLLASATAPNATSKVKSIELHNPSHSVELKYTGTMTFKWRFEWEEHEFEWRREECYIIRKPDPAVLVAITKEPSGRIKTSSVQILDYNLNRFDINDRKGLEILILTALLTFQDTNEAYHTPPPPPPSSTDTATPTSTSKSGFFGISMSRRVSDTSVVVPTHSPPALPPKPAPKSGVDKIAETHAVHAALGEGESNEVEVGEEGDVEEYAEYAEHMLRDDAMLFVTIRSASATQVPKVLQVVEHTKRLRHKAGLDEDQDLFQYVIYDTAKKGPKRINLDDRAPSHASYSPPTSLTVHLSKIDMPELRPKLESLRAGPSTRARPTVTESPSPIPEREKARHKEKEREKAQKQAEKEAQKEAKRLEKLEKNKKADPERPQPNKLTRPTLTATTSSTSINSSSYQRARPLSYHAPSSHPQTPSPSTGPLFPQPQTNYSSFYNGSPFPSNSSTMSAPQPPPRHPRSSPRPQSFYGASPSGSSAYGHYGSGYLMP